MQSFQKRLLTKVSQNTTNEFIERKVGGFGRGRLQLEDTGSCYTQSTPVYGVNCAGVPGYEECDFYMKGYNVTTICNSGTGGDGGYGGAGGGSGGGGGGGAPTAPEILTEDVPDVDPSESDWATACPPNFVFADVTEHDLWQEARITNIYVNLGVIDYNTGEITD